MRELANLIERLVVISEEDYIEMHDLPNEVIGLPMTDSYSLNLPEDISLKEALNKSNCFIRFLNLVANSKNFPDFQKYLSNK